MDYSGHDELESKDANEADGDQSPTRGDGHEAFDLAALCLSPLASPAMTTAASGSEGFSVLSDGMSLATDDKDDESAAERGDDDETKDLGDAKAERGEDKDGEEDDRRDGGDKETGDGDRNTDDSRGAHRGEGGHEKEPSKREEAAVVDDISAVSKLPLRQDNAAREAARSFSLSNRSTYRRDSDSDDDMTVECASPRDPMELEDAQPPTTYHNIRSHKSTDGHNSEAHEIADVVITSSGTTATAPHTALAEAQYSVKTIFPIVYEKPHASTSRIKPGMAQESSLEPKKTARVSSQPQMEAAPSNQLEVKTRIRARTAGVTDTDVKKSHQERETALTDQHQSSTKSLHLQLQVADTDRKQLAQRNARLRSQLELLAADLVRTKAEAAKWKTENELYAAKMPKLQAELSDETTQVDEKHAQTIQSQLEISQLRAKVQVLQTRAGNLDVQVEKLQHELRAAKKEVRRRAILQQQSEEKIKRLETDLHEAKANHAHELQLSKQKLTATVQRLDHERIKAVAELKKTQQQQIDVARAALTKTTKKWKELEHAGASREQELLVLKKRVEEFDDAARARDRQSKTTESLLDRAERTEASLRSQVAALKVQVQAAEREKSKALRASSFTLAARPPLRVSPSTRPVPMSVSSRSPRIPSVPTSTVSADTSVCSCCRMIIDSMAKADRLGESDDDHNNDNVTESQNSPADCARCLALETEVTTAQEELMQVRTLHASELKVQATAYERMLAAFRGGPDSLREATLTCA